jgi:hypothetical protein
VKYLVQFATFPPPAEPGVKSGTWTRVGDTGADPTFVFLLAHRMINAPRGLTVAFAVGGTVRELA